LPHCLLCRRTKGTPAVWVPAEAETVGGSDARPRPYKLCRVHAHTTPGDVSAWFRAHAYTKP
jgi:hypothetical protein